MAPRIMSAASTEQRVRDHLRRTYRSRNHLRPSPPCTPLIGQSLGKLPPAIASLLTGGIAVGDLMVLCIAAGCLDAGSARVSGVVGR
jgi:hypothetical protein